jgi:hypothetical protein
MFFYCPQVLTSWSVQQSLPITLVGFWRTMESLPLQMSSKLPPTLKTLTKGLLRHHGYCNSLSSIYLRPCLFYSIIILFISRVDNHSSYLIIVIIIIIITTITITMTIFMIKSFFDLVTAHGRKLQFSLTQPCRHKFRKLAN